MLASTIKENNNKQKTNIKTPEPYPGAEKYVEHEI